MEPVPLAELYGGGEEVEALFLAGAGLDLVDELLGEVVELVGVDGAGDELACLLVELFALDIGHGFLPFASVCHENVCPFVMDFF